jgi:hypothetical protein
MIASRHATRKPPPKYMIDSIMDATPAFRLGSWRSQRFLNPQTRA